MSVGNLLNETIDIYRNTTSKDSGGSLVESLVYNLEGVKARIQPVSASEVVRSGRQFSSLSYKVYLNYNVDVTMKDTVGYDNNIFNIVEINKYYNTYIRLVIEQTDKI